MAWRLGASPLKRKVMDLLFKKRCKGPTIILPIFLYSFEAVLVSLSLLLLLFYVLLPPSALQADDMNAVAFWRAEDFVYLVRASTPVYVAAAVALGIGGSAQFFICSRRSGALNVIFALGAVTVGYLLATCVTPPTPAQNFRSMGVVAGWSVP